MQYSSWQGKNDSEPLLISKLGFGTTRFKRENLNDQCGLEKCSSLVLSALEAGISYFDVAPTYSFGFAEEILGIAFSNCTSHQPYYVAGKTGLLIDKTADEARVRIESSLKKMGLSHFAFYSLWSVMSYEEFEEARRPGGVLDGIMRAHHEGIVEHVCISLHCDPSSALKILSEGLFEGVTISMNPLNYEGWLPLLEFAKKHNVWVATMNSLGGGMVPRYPSLFRGLGDSRYSVVQNSLRFISSFSEVGTALSGMSTVDELIENCKAFESPIIEKPASQPRSFKVVVNDDLCTGCGYCMPCSVGINIPAMMQAYNHLILLDSVGSEASEVQRANEMFQRARAHGAELLHQKQCIGCGKCQKVCTNKLPIINRLGEMRDLAERHCYTLPSMKARLFRIVDQLRDCSKVAIWPSCDYATRVLDLIAEEVDSAFDEKCEFFNSSNSIIGTRFRGKVVHGAEEIDALKIDAVVIMHYRFQEELFAQLSSELPQTVRILKLHDDNDVDWFNQAIR